MFLKLAGINGGCLSIQKELRKQMKMVISPFTWESLRQKNFLLVGRLMPASDCLYLIRYGTMNGDLPNFYHWIPSMMLLKDTLSITVAYLLNIGFLPKRRIGVLQNLFL
ncbi:hypothetical protein CMV_030578 [Castanea mollissima]|uniref:Uncharacterized protein n=1 Tax=Castanea mollissima TaxID=60419 RepID=A0A8J4Q356_9ROSI|nr:hypothetical protein CMV_030578 [Castanea mollissima]